MADMRSLKWIEGAVELRRRSRLRLSKTRIHDGSRIASAIGQLLDRRATGVVLPPPPAGCVVPFSERSPPARPARAIGYGSLHRFAFM
jgi:hypothetical protein